jgi:hypothetical protein
VPEIVAHAGEISAVIGHAADADQQHEQHRRRQCGCRTQQRRPGVAQAWREEQGACDQAKRYAKMAECYGRACLAHPGAREYEDSGKEEVRKQFFFEKKNQKTFTHGTHGQQTKVFWFFFSKKNCFLPSFQIFSRLKTRSGTARIIVMIPHQNQGTYKTSRLFSAAARQARATSRGCATRNIPGRPNVMAVSTKPGFTVMTCTPERPSRLRKPAR